jgi:hypothetical protein
LSTSDGQSWAHPWLRGCFGCCQDLAEAQQTTLRVLPGTLTLEQTIAELARVGVCWLMGSFLHPEGRSFTWSVLFHKVPPSYIK